MRVVVILRKPELKQVVDAFALEEILKCVHSMSTPENAVLAFVRSAHAGPDQVTHLFVSSQNMPLLLQFMKKVSKPIEISNNLVVHSSHGDTVVYPIKHLNTIVGNEDNEPESPMLATKQLSVLISGELLESKTVTSWFSWETVWEKHFFTLTNTGLMKFEEGNLNHPPIFIPLRGVRLEIIEETHYINSQKIKLTYDMATHLKLLSFPKEIVLTHKDPVIYNTWVRTLKKAICKNNSGNTEAGLQKSDSSK